MDKQSSFPKPEIWGTSPGRNKCLTYEQGGLRGAKKPPEITDVAWPGRATHHIFCYNNLFVSLTKQKTGTNESAKAKGRTHDGEAPITLDKRDRENKK